MGGIETWVQPRKKINGLLSNSILQTGRENMTKEWKDTWQYAKMNNQTEKYYSRSKCVKCGMNANGLIFGHPWCRDCAMLADLGFDVEEMDE